MDRDTLNRSFAKPLYDAVVKVFNGTSGPHVSDIKIGEKVYIPGSRFLLGSVVQFDFSSTGFLQYKLVNIDPNLGYELQLIGISNGFVFKNLLNSTAGMSVFVNVGGQSASWSTAYDRTRRNYKGLDYFQGTQTRKAFAYDNTQCFSCTDNAGRGPACKSLCPAEYANAGWDCNYCSSMSVDYCTGTGSDKPNCDV